ncbi:TAXI family TRAP transporter solute-binding subunit [Streptomyces sp. NPDC093252]|uniref:TAXI family TRAP transporter solute-binding subunit n=1 Tax=Streptomyces sp. NPDC093252 TaxID=3154980 RepID=UPI0034357561
MSKLFARIGRGRALQGTAAGVVVLGLLLWWLMPLGEEPPGGTITLSTGTPLGVYQKYGELLRAELDRDMPDLDIALQNSDGSQQNVQRVATGEADFAIAAADAVQSYQLADEPGAAELRGVARLYDDYVHIVVRPDRGIDSVADLNGKRVAVGPLRSGVRLIADRVLEAAGVEVDAMADGIDTAPGRLQSGDIDAFFWSGGLPTEGLLRLAETYRFAVVPLEPEFVAKLHSADEGMSYYRATTMPKSAYKDIQSEPVATMAVSNLLITRKDMDPRVTEWLTRTVIDSRDVIGNHVHSAQLVDVRTAIYTEPLTLHAGARRYYRSVKP